MLKRTWLEKAAILLAAIMMACASQVRPPEGSPPPEKPAQPAARVGQDSQLVIYLREAQASSLPLAWEIRKISLDKADSSQFNIPGTGVTVKTSDLERGSLGGTGQMLLSISGVPTGDYTGLTLVTRTVYYEDTGEAILTDANFVAIRYGFSVIAGDAKTLLLVATLSQPGAARAAFRFQPTITVEDEPITPRGKLVYVSNESSSNISVIEKSTKRVVKNVYMGTKPGAMGADQRRNRLYIADRRAGAIYEMDMISQHLLKAAQIGLIDEPVHIEPVPPRDVLIVVNFGSDSIYLVDTFTFQVVDTIAVGDGPVDAVYSASRDLAFVVNLFDGTVTVVNLAVQPAVVDTTLQVELRPTGVAIDDGMGWLYVTNSSSSDLSILKLETMAIERSVFIGNGAGDVTLDPYGRRLFVSMSETNEILCVDPYTGVTIYSVRLPSKPGSLMFDPDEKKLYATVPGKNAVVVIDTITREIQNWIETGEGPYSMAIRP